ncbi:diguanylate cyclase [Alteromonas facilis]|uniref:diguanylate cyclase n=1 Tax=Alteromonas facilis TaxID=2048004 RepID=UPI000C291F97|nr:diguanylate cyclase [Alteromonas facilis]
MPTKSLASLEEQIDILLSSANILIVEDSYILSEMYASILSDVGNCSIADNVAKARELLSSEDFDIAIFDHHLPDGDGLELCKEVRARFNSRQLPVILITGSDEEDLEETYWEEGCSDYVLKPVKARTLVHRVTSQLRLKFACDLLARMSSFDQLTGLYNRHYLESVMKSFESANAESLSVLMIDIDHFKRYNDEYGHQKGDECLARVSEIIKTCVRGPDEISVRYGGEEFMLILPNTNIQGASIVAERIRNSIFKECIEHKLSDHKYVTVSIGAAQSIGKVDWKVLIKQADDELYKSKAKGRNTVSYRTKF